MKKSDRELALTVSCPQCGQENGEPCLSGTRRGRPMKTGAHAPRLRRARGEKVNDEFSVFLRRKIRGIVHEVMAEQLRREVARGRR